MPMGPSIKDVGNLEVDGVEIAIQIVVKNCRHCMWEGVSAYWKKELTSFMDGPYSGNVY